MRHQENAGPYARSRYRPRTIVTALPLLRSPRARRLAAILATNLFLALVFLWASMDTLAVRIRVEGDQLTAEIDRHHLTVRDDRRDTGPVSLRLADERSYRNYTKPPPNASGLRGFLTDLWQWDLDSNLPAEWQHIRISGRTSDGRSFSFDTGSFSRNEERAGIGSFDWEDYTVEATLLRPRPESAIRVRESPAGEAYRFWFRSEHGDMGWQLVQGDRVEENLAVVGFRLPLMTAVKAVLRELLWSYFHSLALVFVVLALALPAGAAARCIPGLGPRLQSSRSQTLRLSPWLQPGIRLRRALPVVAPVLAIAAVATALTALIATALYDRIPHVQDSITYLFQARTLAQGHLTAPASPVPEAFRQEFVVIHEESGRWFGKYSPGYPLLLALGVLLDIPWLVGPLGGGVALLIVYLAGRELYGSRIALLAALLGLLSPFFLFLSASFMAHATNLLYISLFLLGFIKAHRTDRMQWGIIAGFFWGMAFMTRSLDAIAFAAPFAVYALVLLVRDPRRHHVRYVDMAVGAVVPVVFFLGYNWHLTGSPFALPQTLWWDFDRLGFGEGVGGAGPHSPAAGVMNTWRNTTVLLTHLFGWPAYATLALAVLPFVLWRVNRWDVLLMESVLCTMAAYVFYWADGIMFGPRYYFTTLPALLLLTARGARVGATIIPTVLPRPAGGAGRVVPWASSGAAYRVAQRGAVAGMLAVLVLTNLLVYIPGQIPIYADFNFISDRPLERVERAGLSNALVFVQDEPDYQWWKYGALFIGNSPWLDGDVVYARDGDTGQNQRVMESFPDRTPYRLDESGIHPLRN